MGKPKRFSCRPQTQSQESRSLFGLFQALVVQSKIAGARLIRQRFEEAWKYAEMKLRMEDL